MLLIRVDHLLRIDPFVCDSVNDRRVYYYLILCYLLYVHYHKNKKSKSEKKLLQNFFMSKSHEVKIDF